ncbi:helix-turn-helix domain-containing protein [Cohnella sp. GCM10020058]|uniref:helix-turn-helix domain-containing protein n=1 Tax=Cohnella sp. GCM10020058 TaxID=3317330 RepID=UPI00363B63B1
MVYTAEDLAKRWRLHVNTVRLLAANDKRLGAYKEGRSWLVRQDSLDAYERTKSARGKEK